MLAEIRADGRRGRTDTRVSIRALKEIHTATHPARLARTTQPMDGSDEPSMTATTLLSVLDDEAAGESEVWHWVLCVVQSAILNA